MAVSKVISVIETRSTIGRGKHETDPVRQIVEYFDFQGSRLAVVDPAPSYKEEAPLSEYKP